MKLLDGSLIYEKIVLPLRDGDRLKRRPDDSPLEGKVNVELFKVFTWLAFLFSVVEGPPFKRTARESPSSVTSPLSVLAPLSGLAMGMSGSPTPNAGAPFLPNLASISSLPMSSLRPNIPAELYVSALANPHSGLVAPLLPGAKGSPLPSSALSPTVKATLLPSAAQSLTAPNPLVGRSARSHGSRGAGHGHGGGGRIKQLPTWMDAPDDLFFHSTQITKWVNSSSYLYSKSVSSKQMSTVWNLLTFLWLYLFFVGRLFIDQFVWIEIGNFDASWPLKNCDVPPVNHGDH